MVNWSQKKSMIMMKNIILLILFNIIFIIKTSFSLEVEEEAMYSDIFTTSPYIIEKLLETFNHTQYTEICYEYSEECYNFVSSFDGYKLINPIFIDKHNSLYSNNSSTSLEINNINKDKENYVTYNKYISEIIFKKAEFEYFGILNGAPQLYTGIRGFIISGFVGNPNAFYKLYMILEQNIIAFYYSQIQSILEEKSDPLLHYILIKSNYLNNFQFEDAYEKQTLANLLLYTASLSKIPAAINTMGTKYKKGYGFEQSCDNSIEYFREQSYSTLEEHYRLNKPQYLEKNNIAGNEYLGIKYSGVGLESSVSIDQVIEYFELEAKKGLITFISQLGQRYLFGQEISQDFSKAKDYFEQGSDLNDTSCMYYLGEIYLNGWGVEKDYEKAYNYFIASETYPKSINTLGYMHYYGYGVEKNVRRAYDYFNSK